MSVVYDGNDGSGGYQLPGKVNYSWIGEAWQFFTQSAGIWIAGVVGYYILNSLIRVLLRTVFPGPELPIGTNPVLDTLTHSPAGFLFKQSSPPGTFLGYAISYVFGSFQYACLYRMAVRQVRGDKLEFGDIIGGGPYFGQMLLFNLLCGLLLIVGCLGVCVGFFVVAGFLLPTAAMVADGEKTPNALSRSFEVMKNDWVNAALFSFVFSLLYIAGLLTCGLGLLAIGPMAYIIGALAYRDMIGMPMPPPPSNPYQSGPSDPGVWPPSPSGGPFSG